MKILLWVSLLCSVCIAAPSRIYSEKEEGLYYFTNPYDDNDIINLARSNETDPCWTLEKSLYVLKADLVGLDQSEDVNIIVGCLVDCVDGKTPVEVLDINNISCILFKNSTQISLTLNDDNFIHQINGYWQLSLSSTYTDTSGYLLITITEPNFILPYSERLTVK